MPSTPLDEYSPTEMAALGEHLGSGNVEEEMMRNVAAPLRVLDLTLAPYRFEGILWGEWRTYGQDITACGVDAGQDHADEEDVFRVGTRTETHVRKWYKIPSGGGTPVLHSTLTWEKVYTVSPTAPALLRVEGGGTVSAPTCVPSMSGDMPEHWEGGYSAPGFIFTPVDEPTVYEDSDILTGAAAAAAGMAGEVLLVISAMSVRKTYGERWASGNSCAFGSFSEIAAPKHTRTAVRRVEYDFELVGQGRRASTLKWTETSIKAGEDDVVEDKEQFIDADTGWEATLDFGGYPDYGWTKNITNLRIVPV